MANQQLYKPKMNPQQRKGLPLQPEPPISPWREFITWLLIMIFFSVWYIAVLRPKAHPAVNIPYTAFLAQVQSGNVANIRIVGDAITGSLVKPVPLPVSKDKSTASAPSNPKNSPTRPLSDQSSLADRLVKALLQEETVDQHMLTEILGPRPQQTLG